MITITGTKIWPLNNLLYFMIFYTVCHNFVIADLFVRKLFSISLPNFKYKTIANVFMLQNFFQGHPPFLHFRCSPVLSVSNCKEIILRK